VKKVFVSGCYDVLHGGHLEFFKQARALGDYLIVCLPSDHSLYLHKQRPPWIPLDHKIHLISALDPVDEVVVGDDAEIGLNFKTQFLKIKPQILAVTDDDHYESAKRALCLSTNTEYVKLAKDLKYKPISSTEIVERSRAVTHAALRVDFAGGWLDVPRLAQPDGYIVNCAISPMVSLCEWPYEKCSGLGGSAAFALLHGKDGIASELNNNVGWQDPVVIMETGLCVWKSGPRPILEAKINPRFLKNKLALYWTGKTHVTKELTSLDRDYELLAQASRVAAAAAIYQDFPRLCEAVHMTYEVQLKEGMQKLPDFGAAAVKYCGSGHGGYAVLLFNDRPSRKDLLAIEPHMRQFME
jgi:cytidyltransferase-like protein